ncbi:MAG: hypothetical protein MK212_13870 [Saprospiraceae bacterium]|nr:hypothetical protein [Saprospiraceae bacterium]
MEVQKITTPTAEVTFYPKEKYIHLVYHPKKHKCIEEMKEHIEQCRTIMGEYAPLPTLVDVRQIKGITKEVRDFVGQYEKTKNDIMYLALIVKSGFSKIAGNIFLSFTKPAYPTRLFTSEEDAEKWLFAQQRIGVQ